MARSMLPGFAALMLLTSTPVAAQETVPATLVGHAILPAQIFALPPADAPRSLNKSGRYLDRALPGERTERLYATRHPSGLATPFPGQPVQGFSGIIARGDGRYLTLSDNGFGSKANSSDAMLMVHELVVDFASGQIDVLDTLFLSDPDRVIPFPIQNEHTDSRYLTGADLDIESIQLVDDVLWIGDEFGPYLVSFDAAGRVLSFHETMIDGALIRSPDHHSVRTPSEPGEVSFEARRSRGFEGMAMSPDGTRLYPLLEGPVWDAEAGAFQQIDGTTVLPLLSFDPAQGTFLDEVRYYPLEAAEHAIGDFNMIDERRALVIERDWGQGDAARACAMAGDTGCFDEPAAFKRVYVIDLESTDANGVVAKLGSIDLLNIQDPKGVAQTGASDGVFTFPFVTIENVDVVDDTHIIVGNDNNYPFSMGREPDQADNDELILLEVPELLALGSD